MAANALGPVLFREEARFLREVRLGDDLSIDFKVAGLSEDQRKWRIRHAIVRDQKDVVATLEVDGVWLDLRARKIRVPPDDLVQALGALPRRDDYARGLPGLPGQKRLTELGCIGRLTRSEESA